MLFPTQVELSASFGMTVTLQLNKTVTTINSYLHQLNWYFDMAKTGLGVPLDADNIKYILSDDNMSLTIMNITDDDAGIYIARYDGLLLYPHNKTCEQHLLQTLRHYPVFEPAIITLSMDGSGKNPMFI